MRRPEAALGTASKVAAAGSGGPVHRRAVSLSGLPARIEAMTVQPMMPIVIAASTAAIGRSTSPINRPSDSVSYTHLDVYKRQP